MDVQKIAGSTVGIIVLMLSLIPVVGCSTVGGPASPGSARWDEPFLCSEAQETPDAEGADMTEAPDAKGETGAADEDQDAKPEAKAPKEGPCLPLHTIEGMSGHFSVPSAFLVNPPHPGDTAGYPSIGWIYTWLGNGKDLNSFTATENLWGRVELGFAYNQLNVGDLYTDIGKATGVEPDGQYVDLYTFNARVMAIQDGGLGLSWMPAVTAGVSYKYNGSWNDLDDEMSQVAPGGLDTIAGLEDNDGWEFNTYVSKGFMLFERPWVATVGVRFTDAAQIGLLGFTGDYSANFECALCCMVTNNIVLAGEYRSKPDDFDEVPNLLEEEDDWWVLAVGFLVTNDFSLAIGYGHFGNLTNHKANSSWGIAVKYEF